MMELKKEKKEAGFNFLVPSDVQWEATEKKDAEILVSVPVEEIKNRILFQKFRWQR